MARNGAKITQVAVLAAFPFLEMCRNEMCMILLIAASALLNFISLVNGTSAANWMPTPIYTSKNPFKKVGRYAIVTFASDEYAKLISPITVQNKRDYAQMYGHDFINAFEHADIQEDYKNHCKDHSKSAYPSYYKFRLLAYVLEKYGYEWVMWSDIDSVFLNFSKRIEEHLDPQFDFIFSSNPPSNSRWAKVISAGNYFVQNTPWSRNFLKNCYAVSHNNTQQYMKFTSPINGCIPLIAEHNDFRWNDQGLMQYFISYTPNVLYGCHFKHVHFQNFNSEYPDFRDGDLVVHFPGRQPLWKRAQLIEELLKVCDHNDGKVNAGLSNLLEKNPYAHKIFAEESEYDDYNKPCSVFQI